MNMIKPWIINTGIKEIEKGEHLIDPDKTVLIQIVDMGAKFPYPHYKTMFRNIYKYQFDDLSYNTPGSITEQDAKSIAINLRYAKSNNLNVVVHCHAGVSRSAAVHKSGVEYGFKDMNPSKLYYIPNIQVLDYLRKELNLYVI